MKWAVNVVIKKKQRTSAALIGRIETQSRKS